MDGRKELGAMGDASAIINRALGAFAFAVPGVSFPDSVQAGGEEVLVLDGVLSDELGHYEKGTWIRNPPASHQQRYSKQGCLLYVKIGHLAASSKVG